MEKAPSNSTLIIEGIDGSQPSYKERLLPGFLAWVLVAFMTASLGIAYAYVYGTEFGILLTVFSTGAIYLLMYFSSPQIVIDELVLKVGQARLPRGFIGNPRILDANQTQASRRVVTHKDAYLVMRASIKESIVVDVTDQNDPHPYWQFSSRNPAQVASALTN